MKTCLQWLVLLHLSGYSLVAFAQETSSDRLGVHTLYAEAGGLGGWYSLNYEYTVYTKPKVFNIGLGGGLSFHDYMDPAKSTVWVLPLHIIGLIHDSPKTSIEIGVNPILSAGSSLDRGKFGYFQSRSSYHGIGLAPHIGYRYQPEEGGLFAKVYFSPLIDWLNSDAVLSQIPFYYNRPSYETSIYPWVGIAIGYTFKKD